VSYDATDARRALLDEVALAIEELAKALAAVGEAYDGVDEQTADRLEAALFKPLQGAYASATRTHAGFATRSGLPGRTFRPAPQPHPRAVRDHVEDAVDDAAHADQILADLQDSMRPVEVGDPELRSGLAETRRRLGEVPGQAAGVLRTLGR
jgi:hypothetical protein